MTETERKALALVNEVLAEKGFGPHQYYRRENGVVAEALCRAIERHEAQSGETVMTEIEKKALALVNEVAEDRINSISNDATFWDVIDALYQAIERHEAYKQEVSDAVEEFQKFNPRCSHFGLLAQFIIPKPVDPLVERLREQAWTITHMEAADRIEALEAEVKRLREKIRLALLCTPQVRRGAIIYDCGDPWEILHAALEARHD